MKSVFWGFGKWDVRLFSSAVDVNVYRSIANKNNGTVASFQQLPAAHHPSCTSKDKLVLTLSRIRGSLIYYPFPLYLLKILFNLQQKSLLFRTFPFDVYLYQRNPSLFRFKSLHTRYLHYACAINDRSRKNQFVTQTAGVSRFCDRFINLLWSG